MECTALEGIFSRTSLHRHSQMTTGFSAVTTRPPSLALDAGGKGVALRILVTLRLLLQYPLSASSLSDRQMSGGTASSRRHLIELGVQLWNRLGAATFKCRMAGRTLQPRPQESQSEAVSPGNYRPSSFSFPIPDTSICPIHSNPAPPLLLLSFERAFHHLANANSSCVLPSNLEKSIFFYSISAPNSSLGPG